MNNYRELLQFSQTILTKAGLEEEKAVDTADILLEGELLGHRTHGLQLLPSYVLELEKDGMKKTGEPIVINDRGATLVWDGYYLPGPWLINRAIEVAIKQIANYGTTTIVIRKSHHLACLAAYLEKVARRGYMILIACSDPRNRTVAPFGGLTATYSPNPLAIGIPTETEPIMIDVSMSVTSNALVARAHRNQEKLPHNWLLDVDGKTTDDPTTFFQNPPSTILPLGSLDAGYKGFGLGLMIEALTSALGGHGRADNPTRWGASVFLQIIDCQAFSGQHAFATEIEYLKNECLNSQAVDPENPVRMPGERGLKLKKQQLENGIELLPETEKALIILGEKYGIKW